jgi:hypothetical protein
VDSLPRDPVSAYDKVALIGDLKLAGFEDPIAQVIANQVDKHKAKGWTYDMGRQEAIRQAQEIIKKSHMALDAFRASTLPETGQQRERPYAERIADSTIT